MQVKTIIIFLLFQVAHCASLPEIMKGSEDPNKMVLILNRGIGGNISIDCMETKAILWINSVNPIRLSSDKIDMVELRKFVRGVMFSDNYKAYESNLRDTLDGILMHITMDLNGPRISMVSSFDKGLSQSEQDYIKSVIKNFPDAYSLIFE